MKKLDFNCDMGESYGAWTMGNDEAVMPYVTSVNIACGFHGGDAHIMRKTVANAIKHHVHIGAHPGLDDLPGFGRRPLPVSADQAYDLVVVQVGALAAVAKTQGVCLHHVKTHGALYNMAANNDALSHAIAQAVLDVDDSLVLYALANSRQAHIAQEMGLQVAHEVFADRSYQDDGTLTPRGTPGAIISDPRQAIGQLVTMLEQGHVIALSGKQVPIQADTLCIHGDQPGAAAFALEIHETLKRQGLL
ncbi:UPF0271 protein [Advenella faeciporci]|uniref:5-oxoprolinase subunit A n=1 Tax=Advenella faeciporci TaxID=797535 RepID=A0A918JP03_9BURK|nr:5-oxoprolinase subunit PxpA [Advenella faeciporci]GGW87279.1 UPF0271 protein [Advenella faeciporci]